MGEQSGRESRREAKEQRAAEAARKKAADDYWRAQTGKPPRVDPMRAGVSSLAVVAVLAVTAVAAAVILRGQAVGRTTTATPTRSGPVVSALPTAGASGPLKAVFTGSRADGWPIGRAGIAPPQATPVGRYSRAEVESAYAATSDFLRAALLDKRVTFGGKLAPLFDTLSADSVGALQKRIAAEAGDRTRTAMTWALVANRFDPQEWNAADEVRVQGVMKPVARPDGLDVEFTYVASYYVVPRTGGVPMVLTIKRDGVLTFYLEGKGYLGRAWWSGGGYASDTSICGKPWEHPEFVEARNLRNEPRTGLPTPANESNNLGDPTQPLPDGCFRDVR